MLFASLPRCDWSLVRVEWGVPTEGLGCLLHLSCLPQIPSDGTENRDEGEVQDEAEGGILGAIFHVYSAYLTAHPP